MADFSRPLHRNHASSAILSKKLSNVHSFSAKSMYDDVFASPSSKLKTRTFSARVDDYSEIFNSSNSSPVSSIPVLDLPAVDKRDGLANVPNTESDYSNIFGGFNDIDIGLAKVDAPCEEFKNAKNEEGSSGEAWIPAGTSPSEADTDCEEKNQVHSEDATYQSVDCKKQFKMSYHKTNIGIRDGTNGTTHIAQFHAVPAFTCVIDEITPLQKTEGKKPLASINDVNSTPDVGEGLMEGKHCRKASSNLSDSGSEDVALKCGHNGSYSSGMQSNAFDIDVNAHLPKVTPCSSPTPNLGNNNSPSEKGTAAKYGTHESDEFESATDETPIFSDEEVDTNSVAAASAAAVRKAIEMAQANIRLAKEAMERRKGLQSSVKHSSKNGLKVKEAREIKIAAKAKRLKEKKGQEISEREKITIQNFPCTDGQNARTGQVAPNLKESKNYFSTQGAAREANGKPSEVLPVMQNKLEGQRELEAAKLSRDFINTGKFKETTLVFEEDNKEMLQTVDGGSDRERWKTTMDTFELSDSDGKNSEVVEEAFEVEQFGRKLNAVKEGAQEWGNHDNKLKLAENIYESEEVEKKLKVALNQVEDEGKLKASQDQETCEEELTETQEEPVEKKNESTTKKWEHHDYEKGVKESQNQLETEMKLNQAREGEKNEKRLEEDYESEEKERKLKELLDQEIYERRLKACECLEDEKKPTASCELEVNMNSRDAHTGQDFKRGLVTVQDQELRVYGGRHGETRLKEDIESERYDKIDEAWKQEKNDNILEEAVWKDGNEREEEEAYKWEDSGLKQRHPCQREEDEKNVKAAQECLTNKEKDHHKTYDECKQAKSKNLSCAGETYRHKEINDNVETTEDVLAHEESWRMVGTTKAVSEPEENEDGSNAVEVANELADRETFGKASLDRDAVDVDDDQITNNIDDDNVNESKENENELEAVDVAHALDEEEILETASLAEDELEQNDIEKSIKDGREAFLADGSGSSSDETNMNTKHEKNALDEEEILETASLAEDELEQNDIEKSMKDDKEAFLADGSGSSSGEANMNTKHEKNDQNNNGSGFACNVAHVEKPTHELGEFSNDTEEAKVSFDQVEEIYLMKAANVDKLSLKTEKKIEASELNSVSEGKEKILEATQEIKRSQTTEQMKENLKKTQTTEEREAKESMRIDTMLEKEHRNRDEAKEKERERERGRLAVERAVREARERAYAEARERAEKTAMEKATAEARQRVQTDARERLDKAAAGTSSLAAKVSMEAKVKAERAAVERATAEARERALEKALSEKAAFEARDQRNTGMKRTFSSSDQSQGSGPSSSYKHSNTSNHGVPSATERFDDGAVSESAERCKARLEKHQQIVERAAKALEEKNKRDLLAQKEQAERNRFAAALDADVKRWSSGKAGNLRALLSTLQYILGPDSGWQPIPLTDIVATNAVKKAYRKATLFVHPDKLQQRRASIQQKYICEKVFDLLKEAWNKLDSEER